MSQSTGPSTADLEEFKEHMLNFHKYGYTMMSLILGYDLGLFDVLHDAEEPLTSAEIADRANLKERYVKAWLGAVSTANLITVYVDSTTHRYVKEWLGAVSAANLITVYGDSAAHRYDLTKEYFDILMANIAFSKGVCECVRRLGDIESCFKKQGPMGDALAFDGDFWKFFGEFRDECLITKQVQHELFPKLETVHELQELLVSGCQVIDIGCGTGAFTMAFGAQYPKSDFTGIDTAADSVRSAEAKLERVKSEYNNVAFHVKSTADLVQEVKEQYDVALMSQVLHNLPDPLQMIEEVNALLKPGGKLVLMEMRLHSDHALNAGNLGAAAQYSFSQFFCLPFSMAGKCHRGFGMGWGEENLLAALNKFFTLDARFDFEDFECLFVLTKSK